jgi:hypothetical protein
MMMMMTAEQQRAAEIVERAARAAIAQVERERERPVMIEDDPHKHWWLHPRDLAI